MSFLAPGFLIGGLGAALGVVALHLLVTRRPRSVTFPTARFIPDVPVTARSRSIQLSDLLLLAVRVLTILFAAAALARPVFPPPRERVVRVIAADVSGSVANLAEVRDSVIAEYRPGDAIVAFDTLARALPSPDSIPTAMRSGTPGSLSAGLVAALRAGSSVRDGADSIELVVVTPAAGDERDRATDSIRALWRGRARLVTVASDSRRSSFIPAAPTLRAASRPALAIPRRKIDTVGAVVSGDRAVIAQFERRWRYTPDSIAGARVTARWIDGEPAAVEKSDAHGCMRSFAISMDTAGDMALRPDVVRFRNALSGRCGYSVSVPDSALAVSLRGSGPLPTGAQFPPALNIDSPAARWLALLALLLAIIEMVLRHERRDGSEA